MNDDLVKRLREDQPVTQDMVSTMQCALQDAAADRIEELEAKLAKAVELVTSLRSVLDKICDPNLVCLPKDITIAINDTETTLAELTGDKDGTLL